MASRNSIWFILLLFAPLIGFGEIIRVSPNLGLQNGIDRASEGDTIRVDAGTYKESNVLVDKALSILADPNTVLDASMNGEGFIITANRVTISGFKVINVEKSYIKDYAAFHLKKILDCTIKNNVLENVFFGIYAEHSKRCTIDGNRVVGSSEKEASAGNAIHLWYCKEMTVTNNRVIKNRDGIYLEFVENSHIENNVSEQNLRYGLHFMFSHNNQYIENTFKHNGAGVAVMYTSNVSMLRNKFLDNWGETSYGLLLKDIKDSEIHENTFYRNTVAIHADNCLRLQIHHNRMHENGWALRIMGSCEDNVITTNNFLSNTFDVVTNSNQNNNDFNGNYWSEYVGYDMDKDGLGDVPHRPVSLYAYLVSNNAPTIILIRSFFVSLLNLAEKISPVLTPETLRDDKPLMRPIE